MSVFSIFEFNENLAYQKKHEKSSGISLPIWRAILRWKLLCFVNHFYFWKSFFKSVERTFLHESDTFKAPFKKEGGELTFSRLGCQHLKISLRWMHPQRLNLKIAFSLRRCRNSKKSLRWMHPQRLNFWTMPGTAVGATFGSSKVGPEWSLFCMALTFLMEKYENRNATADQRTGSPPRVRILQRR